MRQRLKPERAWSANAAELVADNVRRESPAMRYRQAPEPLDLSDWQRSGQSPRLRNIAESLRVTRDMVRRAMITKELTRSQKAYVYYLAGKKSELDPDEYIKAFNLTSPVVVAPKIEHRNRAFAQTWMMTEPLRTFDGSWWPDGIRPRDEAGFEASKAVMTMAAGLRSSAYIKDAWDDLDEKPRLSALFSDLAAESGRPFARGEYSSCTRHLSRLAQVVNELAPKYTSQIVQEFAVLFPKAPIGRFLSADANLAASWTRQRSGKVDGVFDPEREAWLTKRHPDSTFRYYSHGSNGREDADEETGVTVRPGGRAVRGNLFTVGTEGSIQIALAIKRSPANYPEPRSCEDLASTVLKHWPESPVEFLVADKLWYQRPPSEELLRRWSINLVAIPKTDSLKRVRQLDQLKDRLQVGFGAATIRGDGRVTCVTHGQPCRFDTLEMPSRAVRRRDGLEDGDWAAAGKFRYRVVCDHGCGRLSLPVRLDYKVLSALPNHDHGRPGKYALRLALQGHRNMSESGFSSIQVAHSLLGKDGTRSRLQMEVNEALLWLAFLTKAGNLLTAERIHRGLAAPDIAEQRFRLREVA